MQKRKKHIRYWSRGSTRKLLWPIVVGRSYMYTDWRIFLELVCLLDLSQTVGQATFDIFYSRTILQNFRTFLILFYSETSNLLFSVKLLLKVIYSLFIPPVSLSACFFHHPEHHQNRYHVITEITKHICQMNWSIVLIFINCSGKMYGTLLSKDFSHIESIFSLTPTHGAQQWPLTDTEF